MLRTTDDLESNSEFAVRTPPNDRFAIVDSSWENWVFLVRIKYEPGRPTTWMVWKTHFTGAPPDGMLHFASLEAKRRGAVRLRSPWLIPGLNHTEAFLDYET